MAVSIRGVGGLPDGRVVLPDGPILALAGANGTGKSKFLACLLAPWTGQIPSPRGEDETAEVFVELRLTKPERVAIEKFSIEIGWGAIQMPSEVRVGVRRSRMVGQQRIAEPSSSAATHLWDHANFLSSQPSLNVVFLPAERRLLEPRQQGIDLNQLSEAISFQKTAESRNAVNNYGRLDDQEFEDFAKALCVAASLPAEETTVGEEAVAQISRIEWDEFKSTVNALIAPKELLGLTRSHPDQLRIRTLQGDIHAVRDLSSGERQALIIISRILRAGTGTPLVMIDEPDAYLHPNLSKRLFLALEEGVGPAGQLIVATHSPAILDGIPPASILRLEHGGPPLPVADETERLDLYRAAGFRSSALTQSDLLVLTEGATDASILTLAVPELSRASLLAVGGKAQVVRQVEQLMPFDLPVLGVVDRDLNLADISPDVAANVFMWPASDIEGVYLGASESLQVMIDRGMINRDYRTTESLTALVRRLCAAQRENVIAEIARADAVFMSGYKWPSPRGEGALERLRESVRGAAPISSDQLEDAIQRAVVAWDVAQADPLTVVRGKYILGAFVSEASEMKSGRALIEATARHRPAIPAIMSLATMIQLRLTKAP